MVGYLSKKVTSAVVGALVGGSIAGIGVYAGQKMYKHHHGKHHKHKGHHGDTREQERQTLAAENRPLYLQLDGIKGKELLWIRKITLTFPEQMLSVGAVFRR